MTGSWFSPTNEAASVATTEKIPQITQEALQGHIGAIASATAEQTRGLIPGAVENSLASVVDYAQHVNPDVAATLTRSLAQIAQYAAADNRLRTV